MRSIRPALGTLTLITLAVGACGAEPEPAADARPVAVRQAALPGVNPLPEQVINQLRAEYPVLRSEPAPEPKPSPDANPERIPDRLREAASPRVLQTATGGATFYADRFEGRRTASGIPFRQNQMVAAHRGFPFGTLLRVTNLRNDRSVNVRVVDRGPFGSAANKRRTMVDLSRRAATGLDYVGAGRAQVRVEVLEWGDGIPRVS
jgi:rare lipoprotein A